MAPELYWKDESVLMSYIKWIEEQLNIRELDDWYEVTREQLKEYHGYGILAKHSSIYDMLLYHYPGDIFSSYNWKCQHSFLRTRMEALEIQESEGWILGRQGKSIFGNILSQFSKENVVEYMQWLAEKMEISNVEQWYDIGTDQLMSIKEGGHLLMQGGTKLIALYFPEYPWDFGHVPKYSKAQIQLSNCLQKILPRGTQILRSYRHPELVYSDTQCTMELDIYVPSLSFALEYQGQQHYHPSYFWSPLERQREKDREKMEACSRKDITLIQIPYWWDRKEESLHATLHKHFPSLFPPNDHPPIPDRSWLQ
jgi:hypothetical protein